MFKNRIKSFVSPLIFSLFLFQGIFFQTLTNAQSIENLHDKPGGSGGTSNVQENNNDNTTMLLLMGGAIAALVVYNFFIRSNDEEDTEKTTPAESDSLKTFINAVPNNLSNELVKMRNELPVNIYFGFKNDFKYLARKTIVMGLSVNL